MAFFSGDMMSNWIYLFSKFTNEALLFEALAIFLMIGSYASFWVLKKRRLGVMKETVPTGVVKDYLNVLIADAEQLRAQLFGLLASQGIRVDAPRASAPSVVTTSTAADPALAAKAAQLETRMAEQAKAMDALMMEKVRIEKELIAAKSASAGAPATAAAAPAGAADPMVPQLQEKIAGLEARLAEYSVIEDDLANLKRLQQENAQLKASLSGKGAEAPAAATVAPAPVASVPTPAPVAAAPAPAPAPAADAAPIDLLATSSPTPDFEKLVDQVEESLKPDEAPAPATAAPAAAPQPAAAPAPDSSTSKSDEDLVAEFEKMLNG